MDNIIIIAVIILTISFAGYYVYKEKKSGKKCIGCPYSASCSSKESCGSCNCNSSEN